MPATGLGANLARPPSIQIREGETGRRRFVAPFLERLFELSGCHGNTRFLGKDRGRENQSPDPVTNDGRDSCEGYPA